MKQFRLFFVFFQENVFGEHLIVQVQRSLYLSDRILWGFFLNWKFILRVRSVDVVFIDRYFSVVIWDLENYLE